MRSTFVDEVTIQVRSGDGGRGCVAFRREKFVPYGGPSGGDGGRGGDVVIVADGQLSTLLDFRFTPRQFAEHGAPGGGSQCTGRDGVSRIVRVPIGTLLLDADTGETLADLDTQGAQHVVASGGRGGKGNEFFKTSVRQAPNYAQPGEPGESRSVRLELKLLADVGLVGLPNVGKSSLIARISAARPKIANYPFTTLVPNLGVVRFGDAEHFVVADVPGLIPGAHQGSGLGTRFLRHIERVGLIAHVVTGDVEAGERDPIADFEAIERELHLYGPQLGATPRILVLNRIDLPEVAEQAERLRDFAQKRSLPFFALSAASGEGTAELIRFLGSVLAKRRRAAVRAATATAAAEAV
jgi:GTP-binding protein